MSLRRISVWSVVFAIGCPAWSQICSTGRYTRTLFPYFGNVDLNTPQVTIYGDSVARQSDIIRDSLTKVTQLWAAACPRSTYKNVPGFSVDWTRDRPAPSSSQPGLHDRTTLELKLVDLNAPFNNIEKGYVIAWWQGGGSGTNGSPSEIHLYRKCPSNGTRLPDFGCTGRPNQLINWETPAAKAALAHEIGHALGLNHRRDRNGSGQRCGSSVMSTPVVPGAEITLEECELADRWWRSRRPATARWCGAPCRCKSSRPVPASVGPSSSQAGIS